MTLQEYRVKHQSELEREWEAKESLRNEYGQFVHYVFVKWSTHNEKFQATA